MGAQRIVRTLLVGGILAILVGTVPVTSAWAGHHHRHRHPRSGVVLSFRFGVPLVFPYYYYPAPPPYVVYRPYPYASVYPSPLPYIPPAGPVVRSSYGQIRIEVEPGDVAISLDGQFLGLARDFHGIAIVAAEAGEHLVELTLHGYTSRRPVRVEAGGQTLVRQNLGSSLSPGGSRSAAPAPRSSSAY